MTDSVLVVLDDQNLLCAHSGSDLSGGCFLRFADAREMGEALRQLGCAVERVNFPDWPQSNSPSTGQKIAIKMALRGLLCGED